MHNFPNHCYVTVKNVTLPQAKTILKLCIDNELQFHNSLITNLINVKYPHYFYSYENNQINNCDEIKETDDIVVSFTEFCNYIKGKGTVIPAPFKKELKLNESYTAIITKDEIKVNCQTFDHETIKQLYKLSLQSQK